MVYDYYNHVLRVLKKHGCFYIKQSKITDIPVWLNPSNNRPFQFSEIITTVYEANAVLKAAGLKERL